VNSGGVGKEKENEKNSSGAYGLFGLYGMSGGGTGLTYAPLQDNRKMKNTSIDAKYQFLLPLPLFATLFSPSTKRERDMRR
jgi:hypothetical protein